MSDEIVELSERTMELASQFVGGNNNFADLLASAEKYRLEGKVTKYFYNMDDGTIYISTDNDSSRMVH